VQFNGKSAYDDTCGGGIAIVRGRTLIGLISLITPSAATTLSVSAAEVRNVKNGDVIKICTSLTGWRLLESKQSENYCSLVFL
jgi:hypothetical protein